jgi:hypothetical protein
MDPEASGEAGVADLVERVHARMQAALSEMRARQLREIPAGDRAAVTGG